MKPTPTPAATSRAEAAKSLSERMEEIIKHLDRPDDWGEFEEEGIEPLKRIIGEIKALEASPTSTKGDGGAALAANIRGLRSGLAADLNGTAPILKRTRKQILEDTLEWTESMLAGLDSSPPADYTDIVGLREKVEAKLQRLKDNKENGPRAPEEVQSEEERDAWYDGSIEQTESFLALLPPNPKAATPGEGQ